ncbi:MAG TPA: tetratricopeptide repeat protein, partial [Xanthobacteraceae bacterium]|nr:tetratricopeptide repeat protein [Xanthobacteraceae bacterium]
DAFLPDLAMSLNNIGVHLGNLGRREEALAASQEAVDIYRRLAQTRPDAFLPDLASSLNNHGIRLSNLGRREEALAASQEAVDIYRRLAQTRPDAFLPDLATSISVMSDVLAALDRHDEAAQAATQALEILAPFVECYPQTYRALARTIGADILRYSEAAGQQPDNALLARVVKALGNGEAVEEDSAIEALKARIDEMFDAATKTGALDEDALAELPSGLAEQLRAAWAAAHPGSGTENPGG